MNNTNNSDWLAVYIWGGVITGVIAAILIFIYSLGQWGLFGIIFGWIPAIIGGFIAGALWPIIAAILLWIFWPVILYGHF